MTPSEVVDAFIAAIEAKDLDTACALVADNCEYDNVPMGKVFGRQAVHDTLARAIGRSEVVEWVVYRQAAVGSVVLNERLDRFQIGDTLVELPVAGVFEITDGLITLWRDYFDLASYRDQMP